ncbi:hypothetical protein PHLGIDRAFT_481679 [Phlebiopsis gigantea 11061_1 CR5-6]|uniref:Uncharacterized protein n=1 Tax=Phlebiopsis gigantea (strain 11061_1 CR5-6) TaxID=745531 RepID=A0A0C3PIT8_PHLG1|nr:hypothetical protein PHLGIDRAFT_481679 [Phlebiopsis gigantea 11061_1 CR5-6]
MWGTRYTNGGVLSVPWVRKTRFSATKSSAPRGRREKDPLCASQLKAILSRPAALDRCTLRSRRVLRHASDETAGIALHERKTNSPTLRSATELLLASRQTRRRLAIRPLGRESALHIRVQARRGVGAPYDKDVACRTSNTHDKTNPIANSSVELAGVGRHEYTSALKLITPTKSLSLVNSPVYRGFIKQGGQADATSKCKLSVVTHARPLFR